MKHPLDPREAHFERDHAAAERLAALRNAWLEDKFERARLFRRMDVNHAYVGEGCGSLSHFATRLGYDFQQAKNMAWLGYALDGCPGLEEAVRDKRLMLAQAYEIGKLYQFPELVLEEDDWLQTALGKTLKALRSLVRKRLEAMRQDVSSTTTMVLELGAAAKDDFDEARMLAMQKARRPLSNSQAAWVFARYYREAMDPREKREGTRRMPPTIERPDQRGIPAAVVRRIWKRSGGICEFGQCDKVATEFCHVKDHRGWRQGNPSGRETSDLVHGCHLHHVLYDSGEIEFVSWSDDSPLPTAQDHLTPRGDVAGRPVFRNAATGELLFPKPWPEAREEIEAPEWLQRALGTWDTKAARAARKKKREEEEEARKKKILDEASPAPPPVPPSTGSAESEAPPKPPEDERAASEARGARWLGARARPGAAYSGPLGGAPCKPRVLGTALVCCRRTHEWLIRRSA